MTLLREIQTLLERTYGSTGVNFEEFLLTGQHCDALTDMSGAAAAQMSELGRVFLRVADGKLRVGIYYAPLVIHALEQNNPLHGLNDDNILPFMVFLEELDHAVHASLKFIEGQRDIQREMFVRDLELQAKVDVYLILQRYCGKLDRADRRWLKACVFEAERFPRDNPLLAARYRESNRHARRYVAHLDGLAPSRRTAEIRRFRKLSYRQKLARIAALIGRN